MTVTCLSMRGPVRLGLGGILALVLGLGVWATQVRLASAIVASGRFDLPGAEQVLQHPDGGVVTEILVRDGMVVAAGQVVLRLDGRALRSDLRIIDDRLADLAARHARLVAERDAAAAPDFPPALLALAGSRPDIAAMIDSQLALFAASRATDTDIRTQLARRIDQLRAEGEGVAAQRAALTEQLALIEEELATRQALFDSGLAAKTDLLTLRREAAALTGEIGGRAAMLARLEDQVAEIAVQASGLGAERRETALQHLHEIGPVTLELAETRRALLAQIDRLDLRAPVSGVVFGLQIHTPRAVLRGAEPILSIVPQDRPLLVAARVSPRDITSVSQGQAAELVLSATEGTAPRRIAAKVALVSADALTDAATGMSYYLVQLDLDAAAGHGQGDLVALPGMPVEVYLLTGSHTPLAYLLRPFTDYFSRALRES